MENKSNELEEFQKLIREVEQGENKQAELNTEPIETQEPNRQVDILNLPPRNEIHNKKERTKINVSLALIHFLLVILLLLVVLIGAYYLWGNELINLLKSLEMATL